LGDSDIAAKQRGVFFRLPYPVWRARRWGKRRVPAPS